MKTTLFPFVFLLLLLLSCGRDEVSQNDNKLVNPVDVYVAGNEFGKACYWKNGIKTTLSNNNSYALKLYLDNNDIYVLGMDDNIPVFWKNGLKTAFHQYLNLPQNLPNPNGTYNYSISGFRIVNGDVYVVGVVMNPNSTNPQNDLYERCYWKNGIKSSLQFYGGAIGMSNHSFGNHNPDSEIFVYNNEVYVPALIDYLGSPYFPTTWKFGYFKNGIFQFIENDANHKNFFMSPQGIPTLLYYSNSQIKTVNLITNQTNNILFSNNNIDNIHSAIIDGNDTYYVGSGSYFYNNQEYNVFSVYGYGYALDDLKILNGNKYFLVNKDDYAGDHGSKVIINGIETQSIYSELNGVYQGENRFNSITVLQN